MDTSSMIKTIAWHVAVIGIITFVSYKFHFEISFAEVEPLISILQNTSVMIFTIMGIWIAYIYPNAVLRIVQPKKVVAIYSEDDVSRVKLLVGVVILSAFILSMLVLGVVIKTFIVKTEFYTNHDGFFTFTAIWFLLALTYAQLFCIYVVIASSVNFILDLKKLKNRKVLSTKLDGKNDDDVQQ